MEFNTHNLIGVIIFVIAIGGLCFVIKVGKKYIKFLEEREDEKRNKL